MGPLGALVRKDLLRQVRSPLAVGLSLTFPLVFAGLIALVFGNGNGSGIRKVELLIEDLDGSVVSGLLVSAAGSEQMAEHFDVRPVGEEGRALMEAGEASALLRIPSGFGSKLLVGETVTLELIRNPAQGILPEIAEQTTIVLTDLLSAVSTTLGDSISEVAALVERDRSPELEETLRIATGVYETMHEAGKLVFPPAILVESVELGPADTEQASSRGGSGTSAVFLLVLPGIAVWALFLVGDVGMRDVLTESVAGTLRRQLVAPIRPMQIVLAKALYTAALSSICLVLLAVIAWLVGARGVDALAFLVLSATVILALTGFASAIYGLARTERQGSTLSSIILLVFAFLGGSFIQLESLPESAKAFAPFSLFYWGTTGYQTLIRDGAGLGDLLPNLGVLAGVGIVLLATGGLLLGRKTRGAQV